MFNNWKKYGINVPAGRFSGNVKVFCPKCHDQRKDKRDKSLSCNLETGAFHVSTAILKVVPPKKTSGKNNSARLLGITSTQ